MIACTCPDCGRIYRLADETVGRTVRCRECQTAFRVPLDDDETGEAGQPQGLQRSQAANDDLPVTCGHCGTEYLLNRSFAGRKFRCRVCSNGIQAPSFEDESVASAGTSRRSRAAAGDETGGIMLDNDRARKRPSEHGSGKATGQGGAILIIFGIVAGAVLLLSGLVWVALYASNRLSAEPPIAGAATQDDTERVAARTRDRMDQQEKNIKAMLDRAKAQAKAAFPGDGILNEPAETAPAARTPENDAKPTVDSSEPPAPAAETVAANPATAQPTGSRTAQARARQEKNEPRKRVVTPLGEHRQASKALIDTGSEIAGLLSILKTPAELAGATDRLRKLTQQLDELRERFAKLPALNPADRGLIQEDYAEAVRQVETRFEEERKRISELPDLARPLAADLARMIETVSKLRASHY